MLVLKKFRGRESNGCGSRILRFKTGNSGWRNISMKCFVMGCLFMTLLTGTVFSQEEAPNPQIIMETSKGTILLELFPDKAPLSVKNFLAYVASGFYEKTIFHRVIPGFMIQGGGMSRDMLAKHTQPPIKSEAGNGLKNDRGTIAMARTQDPHSATSQFFINTVDNHFLNYQNPTMSGWGYAVFGRVVQGMEVVDAIANARTTIRNRYRDVPVDPIEIINVKIKTKQSK
jgi:cyclophilin family peptidyl-prolyl cis-trans isomerase